VTEARTPWRKAIDHPGSFQVGFAKRLFESRPWVKLIPGSQTLVIDSHPKPIDRPVAAFASDKSFIIAYTRLGEPFGLDLKAWRGRSIQASWFDPRTGEMKTPAPVKADANVQFQPPTKEDWALVIDDVAEKFPILKAGAK
jgi:hypothetical protein